MCGLTGLTLIEYLTLVRFSLQIELDFPIFLAFFTKVCNLNSRYIKSKSSFYYYCLHNKGDHDFAKRVLFRDKALKKLGKNLTKHVYALCTEKSLKWSKSRSGFLKSTSII